MEQMEVIRKNFIPKNTKESTNWAAKVFEQWRLKRNEAASSDDKLCPDNLLVWSDLNYWLSCFTVEARRADRQHYPVCVLISLYSWNEPLTNHFHFFRQCRCNKPLQLLPWWIFEHPCSCHSCSTSTHNTKDIPSKTA